MSEFTVVDEPEKMTMYYAIRYGSSAVFNTLYEAGASVEYCFESGQETLVDAAKSMGRNDIVKILRKAGVKGYWGF